MEHFTLYDEALTKFGANLKDDLNYLLHSIDKHNLTIDQELVKKAFFLCYEVHKTEKRASGVPYYTHPLSVALILIEELNVNVTAIIVAALLHNVLRRPGIDIQYIRTEFGQNVALLISRFFRIIKYTKTKRNSSEAIHLTFMLIIKDVRVFLLQLCNRLHDMRTLEYVSEQSQRFTTIETLNFYIPFAHKFGLTKIQLELESRAFYFYDRIQYQQNIDFLTTQKKPYSEYVFILLEHIKGLLNKHKIGYNIKILHKPEYELFLHLSEIRTYSEDNVLSIYVLINDEKESDSVKACRKALDLIATSIKQNGVADIFTNTSLEIDNSLSLELLMRSKKIRINMNTQKAVANTPTILKMIYENKTTYSDSQLNNSNVKLWSTWMKNIIKTYSAKKSEQIIWNSFKVNLYNDKIAVYNLDVEKCIMPKGSTALDFAFNTSYDIGIQSVGCKVNGDRKDLFTELQTGDVVEIITSLQGKPDASWLNHVITFKAKSYLVDYFKSEYKLNKKGKTMMKTLYQQFVVTCSSYNDVPFIKQLIAIYKIYRITFADNINDYTVSFLTNIVSNRNTNQLLLKLLNIQGVINVNIAYQEL